MATNDFFLKFTSDADVFSKKLAADLSTGTTEITELTKALTAYDEKVSSLKGGNPLSGLFSSLDQASAKLETIGKDLGGSFGKITESLGRLTTDLQAALDQIASASTRNRRVRREQDGDQISADEALRRAQQNERDRIRRGRTAATQVNDEETPAKQAQTQRTVAKATQDATAARNAVKRVADINATLARNATDSANALGKLGEAIRGLTTKTKVSTGGIEEGRIQSNYIEQHYHGGQVITSGGGTVNAAGAPIAANIDIGAILARAGVADAQQAPARDEAHQAQRDAAEAKRTATLLERAAFGQPAVKGAYQVPGENQPRIVSGRINPNETFGQYFERVADNTRALERVRQDVIKSSEGRVGIGASRDLQRIQALIGRRGLETLLGDPKLRPTENSGLGPNMDTVRGSVNALLSPGRTLTEAQYGQVPAAVEEFRNIKADFEKFAAGMVRKQIQANPGETFAYAGGEERRDSAFGHVRDVRRIVQDFDAAPDLTDEEQAGAAHRARVEAEVAASSENLSALSGARRDLAIQQQRRDKDGRLIGAGQSPEGSTYRTPHQTIAASEDSDAYRREDQTPKFDLPTKAEKDAALAQTRIDSAKQRIETAKALQEEVAKATSLQDLQKLSGRVSAATGTPIGKSRFEQLQDQINQRTAEIRGIPENATKGEKNLITEEYGPLTASHIAQNQRNDAERARIRAEQASLEAEKKALDKAGEGSGGSRQVETYRARLRDALSTHAQAAQASLDSLPEPDVAGAALAGLERNRLRRGKKDRFGSDEYIENAKAEARLANQDEDRHEAEGETNARAKVERPARQQEGATKAVASATARLEQAIDSTANIQGRVERLTATYEARLQQTLARSEGQTGNPEAHDEELASLGEQLAQSQRRLIRMTARQERAEQLLVEATERQAQARQQAAREAVGPLGTDQGTPGARAGAVNARSAPRRAPFPITDNFLTDYAKLSEQTRAKLEAEARQLPGLLGTARVNSIERGGTALTGDPAFRSIGGGSLSLQRQFLATALQLPRDSGTLNSVRSVLGIGGGSAALGGAGIGQAGSEATAAAQQMERYQAVLEATAGSSRDMTRAQLGLFLAEEKVRAAAGQGGDRLASAQKGRLDAAARVDAVRAVENPTTAQKLFGQNGFAANQLRHIGRGIENVVGYTLIFSGLDKLKELAHTGLEAQVAMVRLQASLDANGVAAGNLQTHLQGISSATGTPLEHVIEAASELAGVFNNTADLEFGTKIAAQLANISQGTLTAKEAAIGLRDVIDAYGITSQQALGQVGDQIAHLSQLTGVSVKDITHGTTQIAQEAHEFGLSQRQASTIAAYVSRGTGESGEESAAQTSRLLATFYKGPAQRQLISSGIATSADFQSGNIAGVLQNLIEKYDQLTPKQRQAIAGLVGTGIQARAFASIVHIGAQGLAEFNSKVDDTGALARQNAAALATISGRVRQLDEDFQSFGSNLTRLGVFDFIGLAATAFDDLLKIVNATFGRIADLVDKSPLGSFFTHIIVGIGELSLALKLLSGTGGIGVLRGVFPRVGAFQPTNAAAVAAREAEIAAGSGAPVLAPVYGRLTVRDLGRGLGRNAAGGFGLVGRGRQTETGLSRAGLARAAEIEAEQQARAASLGGVVTTNAAGRRVISGINPETGGRFNQFAAVPTALVLRQGAEGEVTGRAPQAPNRITAAGRNISAAAAAAEAEGAAGRLTGIATRVGPSIERVGLGLTGLRAGAVSAASGIEGAVRGIGGFNLALIGFTVGLAVLSKLAKDNNNQAQARTTERDLALGNQGKSAPGVQEQASSSADAALKKNRGVSTLQYLSPTPLGSALGLFGENDHASYVNPDAGKPSGVAEASLLVARKRSSQSLRAALASSSPKDVERNEQQALDELAKHADQIAHLAGGAQAQTEVYAQIAKLREAITNSVDAKLKALAGFTGISVLNPEQEQAITTLASSAQNLNAESINANPEAVKGLFDQSGLNQGSKQGKAAFAALGIAVDANGKATSTGSTTQGRQRGLVSLLNQDIKAENIQLSTPADIAQLGGLQGDQYKAVQASREQNIQLRQQVTQSLLTAPGQVATALSGSLEAGGNRTGAAAALATANQNIQQQLSYIDDTDPQYYALIKQIQDNKEKIGQLLADNANAGLSILASETTDPLLQAKYATEQALNTLANVPKVYAPAAPPTPTGFGGGAQGQRNAADLADRQNAPGALANTPARTAATIAANQAGLNQAQQQEALRVAQQQAASAGLTDTAARQQADLNAVLRQEGVYSKGKLKNVVKLTELQAQEASLRLGLAATTESVAEAQASIAAAGTADPQLRAQLQLNDALRQEGVYGPGGSQADAAKYAQAQATAAGLYLSIAQNAESIRESYAQAAVASIRNPIGNAQAALNETLREEAAYSSGGVADATKVAQLKVTEVGQRQAIADAIEAQKQAEYDVVAAYQALAGNTVGVAQTNLNKALQAYDNAVRVYGRKSVEAAQAQVAVTTAREAASQAGLDQYDSQLNLAIARLNARGGAGDAQRAAGLAVQEARAAIAAYRHRGGKTGTKEYNDLQGALAAAQRTAFDTGLNAQLDTLDFQRETYRITSAQEVQSLQQILKNKQLTLAEQRAITLKIKGLQDDIRQQLTQGGLNIPSDIKLPTAYDVRRSLGPGFGGSGTQVNTVNNNQRVVVTNNVPTAAVAQTIANAVITLINQQTGAQLRASSSTPRLVPVR